MKEVIFELEYTCAVTGERVSREVNGFGLAKQLAKDLARASGRRAIIKRRNSRKWSLYSADIQTGRVLNVMGGLEKEFALAVIRKWNAARMQCVLVALPEWMPQLRIEVELAAA